MASSIGVRSGFARHGRALISIILFQTFLIVWLASWVAGDYLNNQYVRTYVNTTIQADAWMIGAAALVGIVGSSMGLVLRRRRHATQTLGITSTQSRIPRPTLAASKMSRPALPITSAKPSAQPIFSSNAGATPVSFSKPSTELHPAVAALKADLSEARLSLGLASVTTGAERTPLPASPAAKFEDQKPVFRAPSPPGLHPPTVSTGPQPANSNLTPAATFNHPLPPTVIRPMAPPTPGALAPAHQTLPTLKIEGGTPLTPRPVGLQPTPETPAVTTKDISTIITGFMPAQQQKKKESESSNSKTDSQK